MKKVFSFILGFLIFFPFFPSAIADATSDANVVRLTSSLHQNFTGEFRNDDLAQELTPSGKLGQLVFIPVNKSRVWIIDPALIDEVTVMSSGYKLATQAQPIGQQIATIWLSQLKNVSAENVVIALAYGNPDVSMAKRLAPSELRMYYSFGKTQLEISLGRVVSSEPKRGWSTGISKLSPLLRKSYGDDRKALTRLSKVVNSPDLLWLRVRLARLLSPQLTFADRKYFAFNAHTAVNAQLHRLRVNPGKYQITTEKSMLPVTVINDFPVEVTIDIQMLAMNAKILVDSFSALTLAPNSKTQLELNTYVVAPGQTIVFAQITDDEGGDVVPSTTLALNATVIDARVTWFTTGAAILLLLAAVAQSIRRVRTGRKLEI